MNTSLIRLAVLLAAVAAPLSVHAKANCPVHPKSDWLPEADARARIEAMGYKISKFKIDGQCYEIYGRDKADRKVEIYFDTKTLAPVKTEVQK